MPKKKHAEKTRTGHIEKTRTGLHRIQQRKKNRTAPDQKDMPALSMKMKTLPTKMNTAIRIAKVRNRHTDHITMTILIMMAKPITNTKESIMIMISVRMRKMMKMKKVNRKKAHSKVNLQANLRTTPITAPAEADPIHHIIRNLISTGH